MVGCESDRSLNPSLCAIPVYALFRKGQIGSKSLMLWLEFIRNTFLVVAMLARGLTISRKFVQVRTTRKHRSTHISNYQST